jgi:anti-sigma regulatory factor (Ser/Thr protein kinase)
VGTQHAAAHTVGAAPPTRALCGADLADWIVFPDRRFDPGCAAMCQRCAQLVAAAMQPSTTDAWTVGRSDHILPPDLGREVRARSVGRVVVLDATGRLSDIVDDLDHATRFALAEQPRGVVCDVSRVDEVNAPGALRGLALNGRHPRDWPAVPLAIAGLDPRAGQALRSKPLGDHLMVTASLRQALSMVLQVSLPDARSLRLAPHPTAPRAARDFVSRALLDWRLSQHLPAACLVVSELVTNAMIHAGTTIDLTVTEHRQAIRVAVRDHSPDLPVQRSDATDTHGRGMTIVAGLSHAWGVLPDADGSKVVWAVIDTSPPATQTVSRQRSPTATAPGVVPDRGARDRSAARGRASGRPGARPGPG